MKSRFYLSIPVILLILAVVVLIRINGAYGQLVFFRATEDEQVYAKDSGKYDRIVILFPQTQEKVEVYVERVPLLKIDAKEIDSIVIEKEALLELRPRKERRTKESTLDYVYKATFSLNEQGAKKLNDFSKRHDQELFDVRFGTNKRPGIGRIVEPLAGNVFTAGLEETNVDRLKELFSTVQDKVIWK